MRFGRLKSDKNVPTYCFEADRLEIILYSKHSSSFEALPLDREYHIFERLKDGRPLWRGHASGLESAHVMLQEIAKSTANECLAIYLATNQIVALANAHRSTRERMRKRVVFQIAYDERLRAQRTELLRLRGYEVVSVIGNDAPKIVLKSQQVYDLFIIGNGAPEQTRKAMVAWLKTNHPKIPILALNPPEILQLDGADYNAILDRPENWLPMVEIAAG